jgi:hypothetical protein
MVCGRKILGQWDTKDTLSQNITFRVLMSIKLESLKSEYERAAETDVLRVGDTSHRQKLTPHTGYKCLYVVLPY